MIHQPTPQLVQLHRRVGDARLMRWLWGYSIGQSQEALSSLAREAAQPASVAADKIVETLKTKSIRLITWLDPEYPACLRALESDAPPLLYILGEPGRLDTRSIAIIGTRRPTAFGKAAAAAAAKAAVAAGWAIVSGNAPGVDCAGHEAALNSPAGETIVFPPAAIDQYKQVFSTNAPDRVTVASPFVPGSETRPWMFLRRNSLVAAHCSAAVVAETGIRGGTLDTVSKLASRRRPTFATDVPDNSRYATAHTMLKAGSARLIPLLDEPGRAMTEVLDAAANTERHPPLKTAVLPDFFGEDILS